MLGRDAQLRADLHDRLLLRLARNLDVGLEGHVASPKGYRAVCDVISGETQDATLVSDLKAAKFASRRFRSETHRRKRGTPAMQSGLGLFFAEAS
jgi:hypothetical protein